MWYSSLLSSLLVGSLALQNLHQWKQQIYPATRKIKGVSVILFGNIPEKLS